MQKSLDFLVQILYDNQADLQIQPAQSKYDPLAQSVEHLTFNQGVRSSNLRRVTKDSLSGVRAWRNWQTRQI